MLKIRILFFIGLSLSLCNLYSQTDFRKGYIITNHNDTVFGLVDYRGDIRNSKFCVFKIHRDSVPIVYKPGEIDSYRFIDSKYYISKNIYIDSTQIQLFVEYIVNGIADLYYYRDNIGDHYLIGKDDYIIELTNEQIITEEDGLEKVRNTNKHIGLLKYTFSDCDKIQPELEMAQLSHKSLQNLTTNYHKYVCNDNNCIVYEKKPSPLKINIAPIISLNIYELFIDVKYDLVIYPTYGFKLNTSLPRLNEKLSLECEFEIGKLSSSSSIMYDYSRISMYEQLAYYNIIHKEYNKYQFKSNFINGMSYLKYSSPTGKIRPTLKFGIGVKRYFNSNIFHNQDVEYKALFEARDEFNSYEFNYYYNNLIFKYGGGVGILFPLNNKLIFDIEALYLKFQQSNMLSIKLSTIFNSSKK